MAYGEFIVNGNIHLGGADFDEALRQLRGEEFRKQEGSDLRKDLMARCSRVAQGSLAKIGQDWSIVRGRRHGIQRQLPSSPRRQDSTRPKKFP